MAMDDLEVGQRVEVILVCGGDKNVLRGTIISLRVETLDPSQSALVGLAGEEQPDVLLMGEGTEPLVSGRVFNALHGRSPGTLVFVLDEYAKAPPA